MRKGQPGKSVPHSRNREEKAPRPLGCGSSGCWGQGQGRRQEAWAEAEFYSRWRAARRPRSSHVQTPSDLSHCRRRLGPTVYSPWTRLSHGVFVSKAYRTQPFSLIFMSTVAVTGRQHGGVAYGPQSLKDLVSGPLQQVCRPLCKIPHTQGETQGGVCGPAALVPRELGGDTECWAPPETH